MKTIIKIIPLILVSALIVLIIIKSDRQKFENNNQSIQSSSNTPIIYNSNSTNKDQPVSDPRDLRLKEIQRLNKMLIKPFSFDFTLAESQASFEAKYGIKTSGVIQTIKLYIDIIYDAENIVINHKNDNDYEMNNSVSILNKALIKYQIDAFPQIRELYGKYFVDQINNEIFQIEVVTRSSGYNNTILEIISNKGFTNDDMEYIYSRIERQCYDARFKTIKFKWINSRTGYIQSLDYNLDSVNDNLIIEQL